MANAKYKFQDPKPVLTPEDKEHSHKNRRSARDHYGNYMDKLLKVTGGRVLHDYINRKGVNHG